MENAVPFMLPFATVTFSNLPAVFYKYQSREGGTAKQRIKNGTVTIQIQSMGQILGLSISVKRVATPDQLCNPVAFPKDSITVFHIHSDQYEATVDIDNVYEDAATGEPFYKLSTNNCNVKNKFQLIVQLEFVDESVSQDFYSKEFLLRTEGRHSPDKLKIGTIEADYGIVGHLVVKEKFQAPPKKADIAYHLKLNDPNNFEEFEEGDVVGFFEHEGTGDTYIKRLTVENKDKIVHAGVISRSAFLEGNRSMEDDDDPTDTVCVLGIVTVKIIGSVRAGERVYASNAYPGKAVPQSHMLFGVGEKGEVLLGMALQTIMSKCLDEVLLVRCFVCVVLGVSSLETKEEISELYESQKVEMNTEIKLASKRQRKRLCCCITILLFFLALLGILIYQVFVPGTSFRYWLCRRGAIPGHEVKFTYTWYPHSMFKARGIEFTYEHLLKKAPLKFPKNYTSDKQHTLMDMHYFLNVDRCAYGYASGLVGNIFSGYRKIDGGKVFAVDLNCSVVYWASENTAWTLYNISSKPFCKPKMPYLL